MRQRRKIVCNLTKRKRLKGLVVMVYMIGKFLLEGFMVCNFR